jgi:hypothetical protein
VVLCRRDDARPDRWSASADRGRHLLTRRLLARADEQRGYHRHWRRCAFALAHAVLLPSERPVGAGASNTDRLEAYVADYAEEALADGPPSLRSQLVMDLHDTFPVSSTRPYWPYVFAGDTSTIAGVRRLQTPATSWLWRRILTDAIRESAGWSDADFVAGIDATCARWRSTRQCWTMVWACCSTVWPTRRTVLSRRRCATPRSAAGGAR